MLHVVMFMLILIMVEMHRPNLSKSTLAIIAFRHACGPLIVSSV